MLLRGLQISRFRALFQQTRELRAVVVDLELLLPEVGVRVIRARPERHQYLLVYLFCDIKTIMFSAGCIINEI